MSHAIGIDVSEATQDYAYLRDPDQDKAKRKSCQNEMDRFESLITWAQALSALLIQVASSRLRIPPHGHRATERTGAARDSGEMASGDERC